MLDQYFIVLDWIKSLHVNSKVTHTFVQIAWGSFTYVSIEVSQTEADVRLKRITTYLTYVGPWLGKSFLKNDA